MWFFREQTVGVPPWRKSHAAFLICVVGLSRILFGQSASSFDDLVQQAAAARQEHDFSRALALYSRAVEVNPKWAEGWWDLGSLQYEAKQFSSARDSLSHYIALADKPAAAFGLRGQSEFELGEYAKALSDIRKSLVLADAAQEFNQGRLHIYECVLLTRLGEFDEALQHYGYFVRKGISTPELAVAMGLAGLRIPMLPKDVSENQREVLGGSGLAAYQFLAGNVDGAAESFRTLFQRFPSQPNLHLLYGTLLFASDHEAALAEFKRELDMSSSNARAQVLTAWALLMQNKAAEALPYANKAVELSPETAAVQLALGRSLVDLDRSEEGIEHLEHALRLALENLEVHIALAGAYSTAGRKQDAQRERAVSLKLAQNGATPFGLP